MSSRDDITLRANSQRNGVHIPAIMLYCWEQLEEPCGVKDTESRFVYANPAYLDLLDLPKKFDITGRLDSELPAPTSEFARDFQEHDRLVERAKQRKSSLEIHEFGRQHQMAAYFFDKTPFFNSSADVVGTYFHGRIAEHLSLDFYTSGNKPESLILTKPDDIFNEGEWAIAFLLMQHYSQKEIAGELKKSVGRINNKIAVMYQKVGASSVKQLLEFLHVHGWHRYVPENLLTHRHLIIE